MNPNPNYVKLQKIYFDFSELILRCDCLFCKCKILDNILCCPGGDSGQMPDCPYTIISSVAL